MLMSSRSVSLSFADEQELPESIRQSPHGTVEK